MYEKYRDVTDSTNPVTNDYLWDDNLIWKFASES